MAAGDLESLTSAEAGDVPGGGVLVVPLGATEQHGPHLPLATDTLLALELSRRLVAALPDGVLGPVMPYGASGEHQDFPGTLSIGCEALELVVVELGRSATRTFARVVFVSAHGGNAEPLRNAIARLRVEGHDAIGWMPSWGGDAHAGRTETSLLLAVDPDVVRLELARRGNPAPLADLLPAMRDGGVIAVSPNGVLGDPAGADPDEGERMLAEAAASLIAAVGGAG